MKKYSLKLALVTASLLLATNAFATDQIDYATTTIIGGASFKASTSVDMFATSTTTAFGVAAKHLNGNKTYTATSTNPSVVEVDGPAPGTAITSAAVPTP